MRVPWIRVVSSSFGPKRCARRLQIIIGATASLAILHVVLGAGCALASTSAPLNLTGLSAHPTYRLGEPVSLRWQITNVGEVPCRASMLDSGTLSIISVTRDGKALTPKLDFAEYDDGLDPAIINKLVWLPRHGPALTIPISSILGDLRQGGYGQVLSSVSWSPTEDIAALWPINRDGAYSVSAVYALPAIPGLPLNSCHGRSVMATINFKIGESASAWDDAWIVLALVGGIVVIGAAALFWKKRHRKLGAVIPSLLVLVLLIAVTLTFRAPPSGASITPGGDPGFNEAVASCMKDFRSPPSYNDVGGDPAGAFRGVSRSPFVTHIEPRPAGQPNSTTADPVTASNGMGATSFISWDPNDRSPFEDGTPRDPCSELYHEIVHAWDNARGIDNASPCGTSGIPYDEVKATEEENAYRWHVHHQDSSIGARPQWKSHTLPPRGVDSCKSAGRPKGKKSGVGFDEGSCLIGKCASDNGDPHLTTFNGLYYDFQAAGEFIASRSPSRSFEIQVRQEPWLGSTDVSVNTAVAFNVGGDHFGVYVEPSGITTRLNGSARVLRDGGTRLPSGGSISRTQTDSGPVYSVRWPDSSQAWVSPVGSWGLAVNVAPANDLRGHLTGLLGNFDSHSGNDLLTRAGQPIKNPPSFHDLYQVFGDSWRINQAESLFDYAPGQSTATFTNRHLPTQPISAADLPNSDAAMAICRSLGVTDPTLLQACALDVAVTGQAAFSDSAAIQASLTGSSAGQAAGSAATLSPTASPSVFSVARAGQNVRASFAGTAGQAFTLGFTGVALGGSNDYWVTVVAPDGSKPVDGSLMSGSDSLQLDPLTATGSYTVIVNPADASTGTITLTLSKSLGETLSPTASPSVFSVARAGQNVRASFAGTAGQAFTLGFTGVALGGSNDYWVTVVAPDGSKPVDGSLMSGSDSLQLDPLTATGSYTVIVNPADASTGTITLTLSKSLGETLSPTASPSVFSVARAGQNVRASFAGTAGQAFTLGFTGVALGGSNDYWVTVVAPDGSKPVDGSLMSGSDSLQLDPLTATGSYTVIVNPADASTGTITLTLSKR